MNSDLSKKITVAVNTVSLLHTYLQAYGLEGIKPVLHFENLPIQVIALFKPDAKICVNVARLANCSIHDVTNAIAEAMATCAIHREYAIRRWAKSLARIASSTEIPHPPRYKSERWVYYYLRMQKIVREQLA